MIKMTLLIARKANTSVEAFRDYWTGRHLQVVQSVPEVQRYTRRYVQQHNTYVAPDHTAAAPFDGIAEAWFDSLDDAMSMIDSEMKHFGRLDILVNNSGIYEYAPLSDVTEEQFHRHFNINVLGPILITQAALKHLGEGGSIINIGSGVSRITPANSSVYTGSKAAVDALTGVWAREFGPRKIRVNSINPGMVETEGTHTRGQIGSEFETWLASQAPLGRTGKVTDIAPIAVFLASDESGWLTGEQLIASGGIR